MPFKAFATLAFPFLCASLMAQTGRSDNLGNGLRELVEAWRTGGLTGRDLHGSHVALNPRTRRHVLTYGSRAPMMVDSQNRVLVRILLDGNVPMGSVVNQLHTLGVSVAASDPNWRSGALEGYAPVQHAETIAQLPGVAAVSLRYKPIHNVGLVTSQGTTLIHSDQANTPGVVTPNGVTGRGITIGVISDSFNSTFQSPTAFDDVNTGDLPSIGVPDGRPGLKFLSEGIDASLGGTDEGRALAQVAYDVAPNASFCFATDSNGEMATAATIRRLRTDSQCFADVVLDDFGIIDEPAFSDGIIAQAVNDVATSSTLAGKPVAYFSSAGNQAGGYYSDTLRFMADGDARALANQQVDLTTIPTTIDTSGGFHNFNPDPGGTPVLSQNVNVFGADPNGQSDFLLQWDDPWDVKGGITTDLNLLVFDSSGKFLGASTDNNFSTLEPLEGISVGGNLNMRFVVARTGRGSHLATRIFWATDAIPGGYSVDPPLSPTGPVLFGHGAAKYGIAVGAYNYDNGIASGTYTPEMEGFSSTGPVTICCDSTGARLSTPEVRQKPEICGVDGVDTAFNQDPFSPLGQFFGTSAAAPHAAGVAALLLENAGGPGSLTPDQIRSKLIASAGVHDLDPYFSQAFLGDDKTSVKIMATGADDPTSFAPPALTDPKAFTLQFSSATSGQTLSSVTIDLGPVGLFFNINRVSGFRFTTSTIPAGTQVTSTITGARSTVLTLNFTGMQPGMVQFGVGRAELATRTGGVSADLLAGATVTATLANPAATLTGTFVNKTGTGYTPVDGFGLIDAVKALKAP
jgi:hypothetical protein